MTNKMYYFNIPTPINLDDKTEMEIKNIFINHLKRNEDKMICFVDSKKNEDSFYTFWQEDTVKIIAYKLKEKNILFSYKDVTENVLQGIEANNIEYAKTFQVGEHKILLDQFLLENQTINNILDKINIHGLETLSPIETEILNQRI